MGLILSVNDIRDNMTQQPSEQSPEQPASRWISDTNSDGFEEQVLIRSQDVPVIVDFWAPWCAPCRELAPLLEKLVEEAAGRWELVRVNIDDCQDLAGAFGVESIPLVVAIINGQPADSFAGVLPEESLREWLARFLPSDISLLLEAAGALEAEDPAGAREKYQQAAELAPEDAGIQICLARVAVTLEDRETAGTILHTLASRGFLEPEAQQLQDQLDLHSAATETGGIEPARLAAEAAPDDASLQLKLSEALAIGHQFDEAFSICLGLVERDRDGAGQQARDHLVKFLALPGVDSELVSTTRRQLATLLY